MTSAQKSQVLVVGMGGVGTLAAYALETGGMAAVTAVCRSNFDAVNKNGISIDSLDHGEGISNFRPTQVVNAVPDVSKDGQGPFEYLVVTTKNIPDVRPNVLDIITPAITPRATTIVMLQNGLNIEKPIMESFPDNVVLSGVSFIGATETSHGVVRHDDGDRAKLGPFPNQEVSPQRSEETARRFIHLYTACGKVNWSYDEDVSFTRWRKLVYNASYNSVSAVLGMDTARMRMSQIVINDLIRPAMKEVIAIAKAVGVDLPGDVDDQLIRADPTDTEFVPSMGQDAAKGNFIEMENIVGEPVREAEKVGVPAPILRTIYGLLRAIQLQTKEKRGQWQPRFEEDNPYS